MVFFSLTVMIKDFLENFIVPTIQANGLYENVYLMGTSIARPCIIKNALKIAKQVCSRNTNRQRSYLFIFCRKSALFFHMVRLEREMIRSALSLELTLWTLRSRCLCLGDCPSFSTLFRFYSSVCVLRLLVRMFISHGCIGTWRHDWLRQAGRHSCQRH